MNSSLHTEQEDCDEMSNYKAEQRYARKKHLETNEAQGSWWKTLFAITVTLLLIWWMVEQS